MFFILWADSLKMPAENATRQNNLDPKDWTEQNISTMKNQLKKLGLSIDWSRRFQLVHPNITNISKNFF